MASKQLFATLAIFFVALPALVRATEHVVGDSHGWTLNFNYNAWAQGRHFQVGDTLVFKYVIGNHNIFKVSGPDFHACKVPPANEALSSGNDVITLATPGRKWYICGKAYGNHCRMGQKLAINVLPAAWKATPPPSPALPRPTQHVVGDNYGWTLNFNYAAWAKGRNFRVGDTIVFKYPVGYHNVFKVSGPDFLACKVPPANEALTSGNDVITLATPGRKWYIVVKPTASIVIWGRSWPSPFSQQHEKLLNLGMDLESNSPSIGGGYIGLWTSRCTRLSGVMIVLK